MGRRGWIGVAVALVGAVGCSSGGSESTAPADTGGSTVGTTVPATDAPATDAPTTEVATDAPATTLASPEFCTTVEALHQRQNQWMAYTSLAPDPLKSLAVDLSTLSGTLRDESPAEIVDVTTKYAAYWSGTNDALAAADYVVDSEAGKAAGSTIVKLMREDDLTATGEALVNFAYTACGVDFTAGVLEANGTLAP